MDYKYIEQLLERYFECETSLGEENVLKAFFAQENVPVSLLAYRSIFTEAEQAKNEETLSANFDKRILSLIGEEQAKEPVKVKARIISMQRRLQPLYKAAACVAIILALGQAAQMPYNDANAEQENIARSLEKPAIQQDQNAVAKSDSVKNNTDATLRN
ncbi:MAG: pyruvate ferredoxin oxidoreductase [Prevotella sp.]|nr:pyruvate ferredoxin oxidoreductase [Candidatus Prevotella equi]